MPERRGKAASQMGRTPSTFMTSGENSSNLRWAPGILLLTAEGRGGWGGGWFVLSPWGPPPHGSQSPARSPAWDRG